MVSLQLAQVACCAPPTSPFTQGAQGTNTTTPTIAFVFYSFQLNGTAGNLLFIAQNTGRVNTSVLNVYYDDSPVNDSFVTSNDFCAAFLVGLQCRMTLAFGPASLPLPAQGSLHSFRIQTSDGGSLDYTVTAGMSGANCGLAHC